MSGVPDPDWPLDDPDCWPDWLPDWLPGTPGTLGGLEGTPGTLGGLELEPLLEVLEEDPD